MFPQLIHNQIQKLHHQLTIRGSLDWEINVGLGCSDLVSLESLPGFIPLSFILTEDEEFFSHRGFSKRAFLHRQLLFLTGKSGFGTGSTISQQLVKQLFLSVHRSIHGKLLQLIYSFCLEREFNKEQILTIYLNSVRLGNVVFGLKNAARIYFKKSPAALKLTEALFLAYAVRSPMVMNRNLVNRNLPEPLKQFMRIKLFELFFFYVSAYGINSLKNFEGYSFAQVREAFKQYPGRKTYQKYDRSTYFEVEWLVKDHLADFFSWYNNYIPEPNPEEPSLNLEIMQLEFGNERSSSR